MLTRIELKNFMSHAHTVIEPAAGLTVLIGPNNVGKSAIACALQILCYNDNSTYVLRHGEKTCSVTVETDDGHVITWRRKNAASYEIDGQKFDRLGRDIPEELHRALRLPKVDANNKEEFDVHFGSQKSPIFLIDSPGATAARFFASSSDAIRLVQMQQRHKEKIRDAKKDRAQLEKLSTKVNGELEALSPIVAIEPRITELEKLYQSVQQSEQRSKNLGEEANLLAEAEHATAFRQAETDRLQSLAKPPEMQDTALLLRTIEDIAHEAENHQLAAAQTQKLEGLEPLPELADVQSLAHLIRDLETAKSQELQNSTVASRLAELTAPPALEDVRELHRIHDDFKRSRHDIRRWERELAFLGDVETLDVNDVEPLEGFLPVLEQAFEEVRYCERAALVTSRLTEQPKISDSKPLAELLSEIEEEQKTVSEYEMALAVHTAEMEQIVAEMKSAAQEETCPVCGGPIDVDRLLAQSGLRDDA